MKLLLEDLNKMLSIYKFKTVCEDDNYYIVNELGNKLTKIESYEDTIDTRFIDRNQLYHFRVTSSHVRKILTSYKGAFIVDTLVPQEEYKIIKKKTCTTYLKKLYSGNASKVDEFITGNGYYKTSIKYEKDNCYSVQKTFVRYDDNDLLNTTGLYEIQYGNNETNSYNYIAKINKECLSLCEISDEEFIKETPIGEHMTDDELRRCIKAFISSNQSQNILSIIEKGMPKDIKLYFKEILDKVDEMVLIKDEDLKYINQFFNDLDKYDIIKSDLDKQTKESVVKLTRCEF